MRFFLPLLVLLLSLNGAAQATPEQAQSTVVLHTSAGEITIRLYPDKAPVSVANFLAYAREGYYNGTIFHRVVRRFVIQAGGFTADGVQKPTTRDPIVNESGNGLYNDRWTVAMARPSDPNGASSQFYINLRTNSDLNKKGDAPGYAVFGEVIDGQYVARDISLKPTHSANGMDDFPIEPVVIHRVEIRE